jgi:hypothetical protein
MHLACSSPLQMPECSNKFVTTFQQEESELLHNVDGNRYFDRIRGERVVGKLRDN